MLFISVLWTVFTLYLKQTMFHFTGIGLVQICANVISLIMNADSMQVVPTKQQQRASEQQIANTSQSGNVIAFPQTPVP